MTDFESGRQDALMELEKALLKHLDFLKSIENQQDILISKEYRDHETAIYKRILSRIDILKNKERDNRSLA